MGDKEFDLESVFSRDSNVTIDEGERLRFAKQLLWGVGLICAGVFISYGIWPENKALAAIFELIKIGVLPLITLVISFYFPKSNY